MSSHLLAIAVGPVQEFIAAARRTRDLWFGSYLLSEVSKAVARSVRDAGGELIFPHPNADLAPASKMNVANVILAQLPEAGDARRIAEDAKKAAAARWREFANEVIADDDINQVVRNDRNSEQGDLWTEQVDDVVEFYAAWVPLPTPADYKAARDRVMRLLNGRKTCRDFIAAGSHPLLPKSSLDGMRDTVLRGPARNEDPQTYRNSWSKATHRKLRVRTGEQLDVIGVVKRAADVTQPYPSVSRVAADPWIRGHQGQLGAVIAECQRLGSAVIRRLNVSEEGHPHYAAFPFEGTAVFRNRHRELEQETGLNEGVLRPLAEAVARLGEPNPYLAVIVADGDKMGQTIAQLQSAEEHRRFSETLAHFAGQARAIVHKHHGILVYAGGDDVLAFAPLDMCLGCARALHDQFGELLKPWGEKAGTKITLSVGVAIGHFMENLEDLLEYGRAAEKNAKQPDRDGLAIHLHKRGGSPLQVRLLWNNKPDERLTANAQLFIDQAIPGRLPYELRRLADVYENWPAATLPQALRQDVLRIIAKKQPGGGGSVRDRLQPLLDGVSSAENLRRLAEELLIARQIATACRQADGRDNGEDE